MHSWADWIDWISKALISFSGFQIVKILSGLKLSVEKLNVKMATIIERTVHHTKKIDHLDHRIQKIEDKLPLK